jgi:sugar lactone lactonase YvrE
MAIAVDSAGAMLCVAEGSNKRVQKLTTDGRPFGALPLGEWAYNLAVDPAGGLWVSTASRLLRISPSLQILDQIPVKNGIATPIAFDAAGAMYIAEGPVIHQVPRAGSARAWGSSGTAPGQFSWIGAIAVDGRGQVYVLDLGNKRIQQYTP